MYSTFVFHQLRIMYEQKEAQSTTTSTRTRPLRLRLSSTCCPTRCTSCGCARPASSGRVRPPPSASARWKMRTRTTWAPRRTTSSRPRRCPLPAGPSTCSARRRSVWRRARSPRTPRTTASRSPGGRLSRPTSRHSVSAAHVSPLLSSRRVAPRVRRSNRKGISGALSACVQFSIL